MNLKKFNNKMNIFHLESIIFFFSDIQTGIISSQTPLHQHNQMIYVFVEILDFIHSLANKDLLILVIRDGDQYLHVHFLTRVAICVISWQITWPFIMNVEFHLSSIIIDYDDFPCVFFLDFHDSSTNDNLKIFEIHFFFF